MSAKRFPKEDDLVAVTIKQVEYYGYVSQVDYDVRCPRVCVEFYPRHEVWYDFAEIRLVNFPTDIKS